MCEYHCQRPSKKKVMSFQRKKVESYKSLFVRPGHKLEQHNQPSITENMEHLIIKACAPVINLKVGVCHSLIMVYGTA